MLVFAWDFFIVTSNLVPTSPYISFLFLFCFYFISFLFHVWSITLDSPDVDIFIYKTL